MSDSSGNFEWYLARDGQQHGPLTATELDKFIELGHLKPTDLLWRVGFEDWRGAAEVFPPRPPEPVAPPPAPPKQPPIAQSEPLTAPAAGIAAPGTSTLGNSTPGNGPAFNAPFTDNNTGPRDNSSDVTQPVNRTFEPQNRGPAHPQTDQAKEPDRHGNTARDFDPRDAHASNTAHQPFTGARHLATAAPGNTAADGAGDGLPPEARSPLAAAWPSPQEIAEREEARLAAERNAQALRDDRLGTPGGHTQQGEFARPDTHGQPIGAIPPSTAGSAGAAAVAAELDDDAFYEDDEEVGRSGWLMVAAALFVFVLVGAGGLFAYNNQAQISAFVTDLTGSPKSNEVAVVKAPKGAARQPIKAARPRETTRVFSQPNSAPPATAPKLKALPELPILKSKLWQFAQKEFGEWTEKRMAYVRQLSEQDKPKEEANRYLINSFVKFRRDNAAIALLAPPERLAQIANAFVDSLKALTAKTDCREPVGHPRCIRQAP